MREIGAVSSVLSASSGAFEVKSTMMKVTASAIAAAPSARNASRRIAVQRVPRLERGVGAASSERHLHFFWRLLGRPSM